MTTAYPLQWPDGWPRTPDSKRRARAPFKVGADKARRDLVSELRMLGATDVVVSSMVAIRQDGMPYADAARRTIRDPGVAVYFRLRGGQLTMARDLFWRVEDNLRSIGLAIANLRGLERHGGAYMMEKAFSGFAALPPPFTCWQTLGLEPTKDEATIRRAFWDRAHQTGASGNIDMDKLVKARDEALEQAD